jgi:hypothetical protein
MFINIMLRLTFTSILLIVNISIAIFLPISPTPATVQAYVTSTFLSVCYSLFFLIGKIVFILKINQRSQKSNQKSVVKEVSELMVYMFILSWQYTVLMQFHKKLEKANNNECWSKQKWNKETKPLKNVLYTLIVVQSVIFLSLCLEKLPIQLTHGGIQYDDESDSTDEESSDDDESDSTERLSTESQSGNESDPTDEESSDDDESDSTDEESSDDESDPTDDFAHFSSMKIKIIHEDDEKKVSGDDLSDIENVKMIAKNKLKQGPIHLHDTLFTISLNDILWMQVTQVNQYGSSYSGENKIPVKIQSKGNKMDAVISLNNDDSVAFFKFVHKLPKYEAEKKKNKTGFWLEHGIEKKRNSCWTKFFEWLVVCKNHVSNQNPWGSQVQPDKKLTDAKMLNRIRIRFKDSKPIFIFQIFDTDYFITSIADFHTTNTFSRVYVTINQGKQNAINSRTNLMNNLKDASQGDKYTIYFANQERLFKFTKEVELGPLTDYIY